MATPASIETVDQIYAHDDLAQPPKTVPDPKQLTKFVRTKSHKSLKNSKEVAREARSSGSSRVSSALRVRHSRLGEDSKRKPKQQTSSKATLQESQPTGKLQSVMKQAKLGPFQKKKEAPAKQKTCMRVNSKQLLIKQQTLYAINKERRSHQALDADLERSQVYSSHDFYAPGFPAQSPGASNERAKPSHRSEANKFDKQKRGSMLSRTNTDQVNFKGARKEEFIRKIERVKTDLQTQMKTLSSKISNKENLARDHSSCSKADRRSRSRSRDQSSSKPSKPRKIGTHLAHVEEEDGDKVEFYPVPSGSFTSKPGLVDALFNHPPTDYPQIRSSRLVTGESPIQCTRSKSVISGSQLNCGNPKCQELIGAYEEALNQINNHAEQLTVEKGEFEVLYEHTVAQYKQQLEINERLQDSSRQPLQESALEDLEYWRNFAEDIQEKYEVQKKELLLWENKYSTILHVNKELNKTLDQLEKECIIVSERFHQLKLQQQNPNHRTIPTQSSEEKGSIIQAPQRPPVEPKNERFITFQQTQVSLPAGGTEQCSRGDFLSTQQSRNQGPHYLSIDERKPGTGCWLRESQDLKHQQYNAARLAAEKQQRDKVAFALQQLSFQRSNSSNSFEIGHGRTPVRSDHTSQSPAPRYPVHQGGTGSLKRAPSSQGKNLLQSEYYKYQESVHKNLLKRTSSSGSNFRAAYNLVHYEQQFQQQQPEGTQKRKFDNLHSLRSKSNQQPMSTGLQIQFMKGSGSKRVPLKKMPTAGFAKSKGEMNKTYCFNQHADLSESLDKRQNLYSSLERVFQREKEWQASLKHKIISNSQQPVTLKNQRSKSPSLHSQEGRPPLSHERAQRRKPQPQIEPEVEYGMTVTSRMIEDNIAYQKRTAMDQLEDIYKKKVRQRQITLAAKPKPTVAEEAGIELGDLEKMVQTQLNSSVHAEEEAPPPRPYKPGAVDDTKYLSNEWISTKVEGFMRFSQQQKEVLDSQKSKQSSIKPHGKTSSQASLSAYASAFESAKASMVVQKASEAISPSEAKPMVLQASTSQNLRTESQVEPQTSPTDYILPGKDQFFNIQEGSSQAGEPLPLLQQQHLPEATEAEPARMNLNLAQIQGNFLPKTRHQSRQESANLNPQLAKPHFQSQKEPAQPLASSNAQLMVVDEQVEVYGNVPGFKQGHQPGKKKLGKQLSQQLHHHSKMGESEQSTDNEGKDASLDDRLKKLKSEMEVMTAHLNHISGDSEKEAVPLMSDEAAVTFLNKEDFNFAQNQSSVQMLDFNEQLGQMSQLGQLGQLGQLEQLGQIMSSEHIGSGVFPRSLGDATRGVCVTSPNQKQTERGAKAQRAPSGIVGEGLISDQPRVTSPTQNPQPELHGGHSLCSFAEKSRETEQTEQTEQKQKREDDEFSDTAQ